MLRYIAMRLLLLLFAIWAVLSILVAGPIIEHRRDCFVLFGTCDEELVEKINNELGYYDPVPVQYARWVRDLLVPHADARGQLRWFDFGDSARARRPATSVAIGLLGPSLGLAGAAL